jgi:uncharacterized protein YndB with AHSA1/START domain
MMPMAETLVAHVSVTIAAARARVWEALVSPEKMKQYMPITNVVSEWQQGSAIVWTSEFLGKTFEVKGTVLRLEPERLLEYDHSRPIFRSSGASHSPENYQRVTIELSGEGAETTLSVTERNNMNKRELEHSEGSWRMVLHGMKALLEGTSVVAMR